jgi:hypothetical protein
MQVRQPTAAPTVTPLGREDDEVERANGLYLAPRAAAPARVIRRVERLHHHTLVPSGQRLLQERGRKGGVVGLDGWDA